MELYRVLLVDDEEDIREGISRKMDWLGLGFSLVGEAANGQDALELAESLRPDVILTDIKMPFMDGLELCRILTDRLPAARFVVFSGFDAFEYAKQAIQMNVVEYILKPINADELSAVLRRLKDTPQSPVHHPEGNVWNHTMLVVDEAAKRRAESRCPAALMWAALLHDIGKPDTTRVRRGKITSYDHDKVGAELARRFLSGFSMEPAMIDRVCALVRSHMQVLFAAKGLPFGDAAGMKAMPTSKRSPCWASATAWAGSMQTWRKRQRTSGRFCA